MKKCADCDTPKRGRVCPVCALLTAADNQNAYATRLLELGDTLSSGGHKDKKTHAAIRGGVTALRDSARNNRHVANLVKASITKSEGVAT